MGGESGLPVYEPDEKFNKLFGKYDGYTLLFVERGAGSILCTGTRMLFLAPVVFCFNEADAPRMEICPDCKAKAGYTGMIGISHSISKRLSNLMEAFGDELTGRADCFWPCRSRSYMIELLFLIQQARLLPSAADSQVAADFSDVVSKMILYLYTNYRNKITIDELTKEFYMNRTTLAKKFTEEVGKSIIAYLVRLRVTLAASMLRDTMIPVAEVMSRVGFVDSAHFNRMFKKQMLCSPAEYRQRYCWVNK